MKNTLLWVAFGVAATMIGVMYLSNESVEHEPVKLAQRPDVARSNQSASSPPLRNQGQASNVIAKPIRISSRVTEESQSFYSSTDLKKIVAQAGSAPERGSYYYAAAAIRECEEYLSMKYGVKQSPELNSNLKRKEIIQRSERRCSNLSPKDLMALRGIGDAGLKAEDVGFSAMRPLSSNLNTATSPLQVLVDGLINTQDAGIFEGVTRELALRTEGMLISGQKLTEIERSSLPAAILMLACEAGAPCDSTHWLVRYACMANGRCVDSLAELLQQSGSDYSMLFNGGSRYSFIVAQELQTKLSSEIAKGNRSVLSLPQ